MTVPERLDDGLTGNGEEAGPDQSMQWGVRFEDSGKVEVGSSQEAALLNLAFWQRRGVPSALVCRVCGPWQ